MAAARAFVAERNPDQQVAVVTFAAEPSIALPFTVEQERIEAALAKPPDLARGTHIYDAVGTALDLLEEAEIAAGSIVLLSDGSDSGSATGGEAAAARAREAGVRVFAVGLRGRGFRPATLEELADATGAAYSEATSVKKLAEIFNGLGDQLASEYFLKYRSLTGPGEDVRVVVTIDGVVGAAETQYKAPGLPNAAAPYRRPIADAFWRSPLVMFIVSISTAALLVVAAIALVRPRRRDLRKRMAQFVSVAIPAAGKQGAARSDAVLASAEKSFERTPRWGRFVEQLELAEIRTPAVHIAVGTVTATLFAAFVLYLVGGSPLFVPLAFAIPFVVRSLVVRKVEKRRAAFAEQLPDNLQVLSSALRAGHSLVGALSVVVDDAPEPARSEFRRIIADEQLGVPLEDAFAVVVRRMDSRDLEQVALVAALQRETGGNTAEVLDRVCDTIRERFELRRLVNTLTAQGRMSRWVVSLLPVGLLALITLLNPAYVKPLYTHPIGRVMLLVAAVMIVTGSLVIKKIVNIKV
jgi:Flp pilus assembly protein TadB